MNAAVQNPTDPIIASSTSTLISEVVDRCIESGYYRTLDRYPTHQRRRVRRTYIDTTIRIINNHVDQHNAVTTTKAGQWRHVTSLPETELARIITTADKAYRLRTDPRISGDQAAFAMYDPSAGVYNYSSSYHTQVICDYISGNAKTVNGVLKLMIDTAKPGLTNQDPDLVNFKNGILDRKNGRLLPHTSDIIFTSSLAVRYNPFAENKHFTDSAGEDWDVESWIAGLSDDPSVVNVLWEIIAACLRPGVRWGVIPWLYSTRGANGKGSLCELIRTIVGAESAGSLSVADFGNDFMLTELMHTTCIVTDENPVGIMIDKVSTYKAAATHDIFTINRKYKDPVSITYPGLILQCMNSMPQVKDRTGSFYRRQLFVPMEKSFLANDKPEIKQKFLVDPEVCEYVAMRCMDMQFDAFSNPARCREALEQYKVRNDMVREFVYDTFPELPWDFVPYQFLYDLYKAWSERNYNGRSFVGRSAFYESLQQTLRELGGWVVPPVTRSFTITSYDFTPECRLIYDYNMSFWQEDLPHTVTNPAKIKQALSTLRQERLRNRMSGILRDKAPSKIDAMANGDGEADVDPNATITYERADKLIMTDATHLRDYGLNDDDRISRRVARQLKDDPHATDVTYDADISELVGTEPECANAQIVTPKSTEFMLGQPLARPTQISPVTGLLEYVPQQTNTTTTPATIPQDAFASIMDKVRADATLSAAIGQDPHLMEHMFEIIRQAVSAT